MKIYLLESNKADYDEVASFVIIAPDAETARKMAAEKPGNEGAATWLLSGRSSCRQLKPGKKAEIVVREYLGS